MQGAEDTIAGFVVLWEILADWRGPVRLVQAEAGCVWRCAVLPSAIAEFCGLIRPLSLRQTAQESVEEELGLQE